MIISKLLTAEIKSSVPIDVNPSVLKVIIKPQNILSFLEGFSLPSSENILSTNIDESTELIIAVNTRIAVIKIVIPEKGKVAKKLNRDENTSSYSP